MRKEQKELNYNMKLQQLLCLLLSNLFRNTEEMPELVWETSYLRKLCRK